MGNEVVRADDHGIVTLKIDRPNDRNMLSDATISALDAHTRSLAADHSVRVVVITGTGHEYFCGGVFSPGQLTELAPERIIARRQQANELFDRLENMVHPVIAAVNGRAQAGGFEMALACDIRIAASRATFAVPESRWGVFPGAGAPIRLPRLVGPGKAMELIMTGANISAQEGHRIGLVQRLASADSFDTDVHELAEAIATSAPLGNRAVKKLVRASMEVDTRTLRTLSEALREPLALSADAKEGLAAHHEGRPPRFVGK